MFVLTMWRQSYSMEMNYFWDQVNFYNIHHFVAVKNTLVSQTACAEDRSNHFNRNCALC
jgi:hypothetical protein